MSELLLSLAFICQTQAGSYNRNQYLQKQCVAQILSCYADWLQDRNSKKEQHQFSAMSSCLEKLSKRTE